MSSVRVRVLRWHGIPSQVKVVPVEGRPVSLQLSERWQQEIDRVAMREGAIGTDAYLEGWRWEEAGERPGDAATAAAAVVEELEATWESRPGSEPR